MTYDIPETPCTIPVGVVCPKCKQVLVLELEVTTSLLVTTDMDGEGEAVLKPKVKTQKILHDCRQISLPFRGEVE